MGRQSDPASRARGGEVAGVKNPTIGTECNPGKYTPEYYRSEGWIMVNVASGHTWSDGPSEACNCGGVTWTPRLLARYARTPTVLPTAPNDVHLSTSDDEKHQ